MNNIEIEELLRGLAVKVVCAEQVDLKRVKSVVANTDRCDGNGLHWVVFYVPPRGPVEFFDSLGNRPESYGTHFAKEMVGRRYLYAVDRIQEQGSDTCGAYCIYFIHKRYEGHSFKDIVQTFDTRARECNEMIVTRFIRRLKLEQ